MIIEPTKLHDISVRLLRAGGCEAGEAGIVADHLIAANLAGHDSHGVGMLVAYCQNLEAGTLVPGQTPEVVQSSGNIEVWDGRAGFGQVLARQAIAWGIEAARGHGVAVHGLRNSHHIGRVGTYGEIAAAAGMISMHFVNVDSGPPPVAPFGAKQGRFVTNPVCIAIPGTAANPPVILDFATSRVAMGKVRVAHNAGKPIIPGALLDHDGHPTTDPGVMYAAQRGVVLPFGEHKGFGLALICEILAGAIVGSGALQTDKPRARGIINGMLTIVIDPTRLSAREYIAEQIDGVIAFVKSAAPIDPDRPVLIAGEPERIARAARLRDGIEVDETTWAQICAAAERLQVTIDVAR
jgi:uncharacterized oxidoreductase